MARVKTESIYNEKTPKSLTERKLYKAFNKIRNYTSPLLDHELLRKRRKVKAVKGD